MSTIFNDEYTGPRYTYGLRYRPLSIGALPAGWIIGSVDTTPSDRYPFGTVQYPFALSEGQLKAYEMEEAARKTKEAR